MLSVKQKKFCEYYIELGNATEAAKRAGYSERTARSQGQRMLTFVDIRNYIDELNKAERSKRMASANEVLEFFAKVMRDNDEAMKNRLKAAENLAKRFGLDKNSERNADDDDKKVTEFVFTDTSIGGDYDE